MRDEADRAEIQASSAMAASILAARKARRAAG